MPELSKRAVQMPPSPIRKLVPFAEAAKKKGLHVYNINIGQPDISSPVNFLNAFKNHQINVLEYGHSAGLWEYRDELVKYYARFNIHITSDEIVVTNGGSEAIIFAMLATMNPGDEIIIPEPFYTNYNGFAVEAGVKIVPVTSRIENAFALPPIKEIENKISAKTKAVMICSPNNPTGYIYTKKEMEDLKTLTIENDLFFFCDEVYRELVFDGDVVTSIFHLNGIDDRAVMLDSISKRYSVCGARIGCLITHNKSILDTALRLGQARLCPPTMEQLAAKEAINTPQSYFEKVIADYKNRREVVFEELAKIKGVVALKPQGAFYTIVKLPVKDADDFAVWLLKDFESKGETVMLAPGNGFYATPGKGKDEVRIAFVLNTAAMRRSMEIIREALEVYPGRL
ncbi:MAG: pyridoxal phosphate-dependent aminotransferase [Calditrichaceae bacterium]|nr:pyridoxal phosphate-dependent aminotransferase [Calditrichaceae bacterium]RQV96224.1 MAG: pyridoxal phosphate-dependent aminotransferase [Calditrichota bacterium]